MKKLLCFWFLIVGQVVFGLAVPIVPPGFVFLDNSGQPMVGAKLYTYSAGTLNAKTTWLDSGKATACSNPILTDANGRLVAFADGVYKLILKDASDVTIATVDGVTLSDPTAVTSAAFGAITVTSATIASASIANGNLVAPVISAPTISNGNINGSTLTGITLASVTWPAIATPTNPTDIANKSYVDSKVSVMAIGANTVSADATINNIGLASTSSWATVAAMTTLTNSTAVAQQYLVTCQGNISALMSITDADIEQVVSVVGIVDASGNVYTLTRAQIRYQQTISTASNSVSLTQDFPFALSTIVDVPANTSVTLSLQHKTAQTSGASTYANLSNGKWFNTVQVK